MYGAISSSPLPVGQGQPVRKNLRGLFKLQNFGLIHAEWNSVGWAGRCGALGTVAFTTPLVT